MFRSVRLLSGSGRAQTFSKVETLKSELAALMFPRDETNAARAKESGPWLTALNEAGEHLQVAYTAVALNSFVSKFPGVAPPLSMYAQILKQLGQGSDAEESRDLLLSIAEQLQYYKGKKLLEPTQDLWLTIFDRLLSSADSLAVGSVLKLYLKAGGAVSHSVLDRLVPYYTAHPNVESPNKLVNLLLAASRNVKLADLESIDGALGRVFRSFQSVDAAKTLEVLCRLSISKRQSYFSSDRLPELTFLLSNGVRSIPFDTVRELYGLWRKVATAQVSPIKGTRKRAMVRCFCALINAVSSLDARDNTLGTDQINAPILLTDIFRDFSAFCHANSVAIPRLPTENVLSSIQAAPQGVIPLEVYRELEALLRSKFVDQFLSESSDGVAPCEWSLKIFQGLCFICLYLGDRDGLVKWFGYMLVATEDVAIKPTNRFLELVQDQARVLDKQNELAHLLDYVEEVRVDLLPPTHITG